MTWMSDAFNDDFSFCCSGFDHPDLDPGWKGQLVLPGPSALSGDYLRKNGEIRDLVELRKRMVRNPATFYPERIEMEITDSASERHEFTGTIVAASHFSQWSTCPLRYA